MSEFEDILKLANPHLSDKEIQNLSTSLINHLSKVNDNNQTYIDNKINIINDKLLNLKNINLDISLPSHKEELALRVGDILNSLLDIIYEKNIGIDKSLIEKAEIIYDNLKNSIDVEKIEIHRNDVLSLQQDKMKNIHKSTVNKNSFKKS